MRFIKAIGIELLIGCISFVIVIPLSFSSIDSTILSVISGLLGVLFGGLGVLVGSMWYYGFWSKEDK